MPRLSWIPGWQAGPRGHPSNHSPIQPHPIHSNPNQAARHNKFLWGNFAPIDGDFYAQSLRVTEGRLPPELAGLFARNGPNPAYVEASYHWFDGSGFVHAVSLDPATQTANYSAQYVETSILKVRGRGIGKASTLPFVCLSVCCCSRLVCLRCAHCLQYPSAPASGSGGARREARLSRPGAHGGFGLYGSARAIEGGFENTSRSVFNHE